MKVDLYHQRIGYLPDLGCTLGFLTSDKIDGAMVGFATIEQPPLFDSIFKAGHPDHSCVCDGDFQMLWHHSEHHPNAIAFVNPAYGIYHEPVDIPAAQKDWGRWGTLIHNANYARQLQGCIAIGRKHLITVDAFDKQWKLAVNDSESCLNELIKFLDGKELGQLHIRPTVGYGFGGEALPFMPMPTVA